MDVLNKNVNNLSELRVEQIFPLDETQKASYKIVSPNELSNRDFYDAISKLNIDTGIHNRIEVVTDNGTIIIFELDKIIKLKNDKRWIIEWYDGEYYEDESGNVQERKVGKIHREVFAHNQDLHNRLLDFEAINGEVKIIDKVYECSLKELSYRDIQEIDDFDEEEDEE